MRWAPLALALLSTAAFADSAVTMYDSAGHKLQLRPPTTMTQSYTLVYPIGPGNIGQTLGIQSIAGSSITLNWTTGGGAAALGIYVNGVLISSPTQTLGFNGLGVTSTNSGSSTTVTIAGSGGGGANYSLAFGTGSLSGYSGVITSTGTKVVLFDSATFKSVLLNGSTIFVTPNYSSMTAQGVITAASLGALTANQTISVTGDSTGSGTTAISLAAAATQGNIKTFTAPITNTSSVTISAPFGVSGAINAPMTNTSSVTVTAAGGAGVTYNINVGSITGAGLSTCGSSSQAQSYSASTGLFGCTTITPAGIGAITGNQAITLSGDATGSGATAITVANSATQPNIKTFTSSVTVTNAGGLGVAYNINAGSVTGAGLTSCSGGSNAVTWNSTTNQFGCNTISGTGGGLVVPSSFTWPAVTVSSVTASTVAANSFVGTGAGPWTVSANNYLGIVPISTATITPGQYCVWASSLTQISVPATSGVPAGNPFDIQYSSANGTQFAGSDNFQNNGSTITITSISTATQTNVSTITVTADSVSSGITFNYNTSTMTVSQMIANGTVGIGTPSPTAQLNQKSTAALENAGLGSELTSAGDWTLNGWGGTYATGFTAPGNTNSLTEGWSPVSGAYYVVAVTITGATLGSVSYYLGGTTVASAVGTGVRTAGIKTVSTASLTFTPTANFNGTVGSISVKKVTAYLPTYAITNSAGSNVTEIRSSADNSNTFDGVNAGQYNNSTVGGGSNSAFGNNALASNITGGSITAIGGSAMQLSVAAPYDTAIGYYALQSDISSGFQTAIGYAALQHSSTRYNTAVGRSALGADTTGGYNTAMGDTAISSLTTGNANTGIGAQYGTNGGALGNITSGSFNTGIGNIAGFYIADGATANQTSGSSTYLGQGTKALADGDTNETVVGYNAIGNGNNSITLGNTSVTKTVLQGNVGISTTTPRAKLEVNGYALFDSSVTVSTMTVSSMTVNNITINGTCIGSGCGSGGGGSSTLAVNNGTSGHTGVNISSPTPNINFGSGDFTAILQGGGTAYVTLNPNSNTFIQNQESTFQSGGFLLTGDGEVEGALSGSYVSNINNGGYYAAEDSHSNFYYGYPGSLPSPTGTASFFAGCYPQHLTSGSQNACIGDSSTGNAITSGTGNFFALDGAGQNLTSGSDNEFIGLAAGKDVTTGNDNEFIGNQTGSFDTTGSFNTCEGNGACADLIDGTMNVSVGATSMNNVNHVSSSVFVGASPDNVSNENSGDQGMTFLGFDAGVTGGSGLLKNAGAIGYGAYVSKSNTIQIGGTVGSGNEVTLHVATMTVDGGLLNATNGLNTSTLTVAGTLAFTGTNGITGITSGVQTAAGNVGQVVTSAVGFTNYPTSTQFGDLTSISLSAGNWLISIQLGASGNGSTTTALQAFIGTVSGNSSSGYVDGSNSAYNSLSLSGTQQFSQHVGSLPVSISGPTTYYLKYLATYSAGTPQAAGRITAVRIS